jgi:YfiH family protein
MIEAEELKRDKAIRHGFFTRKGGHSSGLFASLNCGFGSGDDKPTVARNRGVVSAALGVDHLLTAWQWHSADTIAAAETWDSQTAPPRADAIVTATAGLAIGILTADCAPVLFADSSAGVIGAAHAGWKGALAGVTDSTIAAMEKLGARRDRIVAVIGPTISQESYEVGPDFRERFDGEGASSFFKPSARKSHYMFDLPGYLRRRLEVQGLASVTDLGLCTYREEDRFFSYRRATHHGEQHYGRQISAIALAH